jgi:hypothetical protein
MAYRLLGLSAFEKWMLHVGRTGEKFMALTNAIHVASLGRPNRNQVGTSKATGRQASPRVNLGNTERQISLAAGAVAAIFGVARRDVPGLLLAALGAGLVYRGASGHCGVYDALGIDSRNTDGGKTAGKAFRW